MQNRSQFMSSYHYFKLVSNADAQYMDKSIGPHLLIFEFRAFIQVDKIKYWVLSHAVYKHFWKNGSF